jgi:hypothetical protein
VIVPIPRRQPLRQTKDLSQRQLLHAPERTKVCIDNYEVMLATAGYVLRQGSGLLCIEALWPHFFIGLDQIVCDLPYCARLGVEFLRIDANLKRRIT